MRSLKSFSVIIFCILFLASMLPNQVGHTTPDFTANAKTLFASSISTQRGKISGTINSMRVKDQSGSADTPSKYVAFKTPASVYQGYRVYNLPGTISPSSIVSMQVKVNYKGPAKASQSWTWFLYDWAQAKWIKTGDNAGAVTGVWKMLTFTVSSPARFVNLQTLEIKLRLVSNNASGDAKLDYEAITVSYTPTLVETPTPTASATPTATATQTIGVANGDFELGQSTTVGWGVYSSNGQTVLIGTGNYFASPQITPRVDPRSGTYMARLGGFGYETSAIGQTVIFPNVTPLYLIFYYQIRAASGTECSGGYYEGWFFVEVNSQKLVDKYQLCEYRNTPYWLGAYVDVSAFAGQSVPLVFRVETPNEYWTYMYLDDIVLSQTH